MLMRTMFLSIAIFACTLATYLFFYLGVYKSVVVDLEERGPYYVLSKPHSGAYHEIGPVISEVEAWAQKQNILCPKTFGQYLDDPDRVDQDRLRSRGGCILTEPLKIAPPAEMTYEEWPKHRYAVGHFSGSPAIGPFKAYPAIKKFIAEKRLHAAPSTIEIYTVNGTKVDTEYLFALDP